MSLDLSLFCNSGLNGPGRDLSRPFSFAAHTYASDGAICVRVPRCPDVEENVEAPNVEILPWNFSRVKFAPRPELADLKISSGECARCGGRGHLHDCPSCSCKCGFCDGSGERPPEVQFGRVRLAGRYVDLLWRLPGLEIGKARSPVAIKTGHDTGKSIVPLAFRFDGGEGLLMPLR